MHGDLVHHRGSDKKTCQGVRTILRVRLTALKTQASLRYFSQFWSLPSLAIVSLVHKPPSAISLPVNANKVSEKRRNFEQHPVSLARRRTLQKIPKKDDFQQAKVRFHLVNYIS